MSTVISSETELPSSHTENSREEPFSVAIWGVGVGQEIRYDYKSVTKLSFEMSVSFFFKPLIMMSQL